MSARHPHQRLEQALRERILVIDGAMGTMIQAEGLDEAGFRAFVNWQIAEGTHGLVPVGTTGESPTVNHDEHQRVVEWCIDEAKGRVPVIAGAGSNSTAEAIGLAQHAEKAGAAAVLVVTPYYNKPTQEGLYQHYKAINDCADIPVIIYNIPGRSVIDMSVDTMARLFELSNIVGVKDATADWRACPSNVTKWAPSSISFPAKTPPRSVLMPMVVTDVFR